MGFYRLIPALRDYLLIEQHAVKVDYWQLQRDGQWGCYCYRALEDRVPLSGIPFVLRLADVYNRVDLSRMAR
jgi:hypothetical protein